MPLGKDQPLVLYELNEVPWRVVDLYVAMRPTSAMARIIKASQTFTTVTRDEGELHPWTTWPTMHRGVTNREHNIRFINQVREEADYLYPPLWEILQKAGKRVGVFGSLQSFPSASCEGYEFYVPDTFAPTPETWPEKYSAYQRFNLRQTKQDGAIASQVQLSHENFLEMLGLYKSGLHFKTALCLVIHLAKEQLDIRHRSRRSVLQALVAFDFFMNAMTRTNPDFCTFFTNHVAGMMHRYWKYAFPEDFGVKLTTPIELFHAKSICYAMDIADAQLARLIHYLSKRKGRLMLASSMGQEAIFRSCYNGEWRLVNLDRFLHSIEWSRPIEMLLAMQPDFNFRFSSEEDASVFGVTVTRLVDARGKSIWKRIQIIGSTINLGLAPSPEALSDGALWLTRHNASPVQLLITDLGIEKFYRDQGTGYHQPEGLLILFGHGVSVDDSRSIVDSTAVMPAILDMFDVKNFSDF